ncbi:MAG TPA: ABC transporter permease [Methylomirabilota bacterium]|nr:ABC transporter permease [Methylomirabilota bacterium]
MLVVLRRIARHRSGLAGGGLVLVFVAVGLLAPWLAPHDPLRGDLSRTREDPSAEHWLGTDELGRDVLSRIIWGARLTLRVGLIAVAIGLLVGVPLGLVSGYVGGAFDLLAQRLVDVLLAFPGVLLAIMIVAIMGTGLENVMIAVGVVSIPTYTRLVRGQVLAMKPLPFLEAARALGQGQLFILLFHVLPNTLSPIIVQSTLQFATSILWAAGLSFLGLGAQAPAPEWGALVATGKTYLRSAPHLVIFPGIVISLTVMALSLFGDALRDALDPREQLP